MIEWIVILFVIFCIIAWYYSQSVSEYRILQLKEIQIPTQLQIVWEEKVPVIVSDIKTNDIWSPESLRLTRFWSAQPNWATYQKNPREVFQENPNIVWSDILGITQIQESILLNWFSFPSFLFSVKTETHIGSIPLRSTFGAATFIKCTHGEAKCILLHNAQKEKLPSGWQNLQWKHATVAHHPMWTQIKFIEVILRPTTAILIPPHWIVAIEPLDTTKPIWTVWSEVHHPISRLAKHLRGGLKP